MIKVVIADDHNLVRQGIRALLEKENDLIVIGEAEEGREALRMASDLKPDVLITDINMPNLDGIEVTRQIHDLNLTTRVIVLSMYSSESLVKKAIRHGAIGYILKNSVTDELLRGVRSASRGEFFISPAIKNEMEIDLETIRSDAVEPDLFERLTQREREICKLVIEGNTNSAIAHKLGISVKTVEKHRANLMEKLKVRDMAGLVVEAIKHNLTFLEG
ncbi:MAG: response regulator transcription factor [Anaerolineaceae bacterium]|nr:response regulator transcription factor [Anaerolineaceae bacterium]